MKKMMQLSLAVLCAAFVFASCGGNNMDADIAKAKEYICQMQDISTRMQAGDADAMTEMQKLGEDMEAWGKDLEAKYPKDSEEAKKFEEEIKKMMENPAEACK